MFSVTKRTPLSERRETSAGLGLRPRPFGNRAIGVYDQDGSVLVRDRSRSLPGRDAGDLAGEVVWRRSFPVRQIHGRELVYVCDHHTSSKVLRYAQRVDGEIEFLRTGCRMRPNVDGPIADDGWLRLLNPTPAGDTSLAGGLNSLTL